VETFSFWNLRVAVTPITRVGTGNTSLCDIVLASIGIA
jgi:hypothetical protein